MESDTSSDTDHSNYNAIELVSDLASNSDSDESEHFDLPASPEPFPANASDDVFSNSSSDDEDV